VNNIPKKKNLKMHGKESIKKRRGTTPEDRQTEAFALLDYKTEAFVGTMN